MGGNFKDRLDDAVAAGDDVTCANDAVRVSSIKDSKIHCYSVQEEDIMFIDNLIPLDLETIVGTKLVHQIV